MLIKVEKEIKRVRRSNAIVIALVAAMLSASATYVSWSYYAEQNLYTRDEAMEVINGVARAVSQRAYDLGRQQKCDRAI